MITIADSGEGMDGETLAEAFSKFGRFAPLDDGRRGAGFGLPLVRQIIQLHGGTLLLQGRAEGAAVSILLPLSAPGKEQLSLHSPVLVPEDGASERRVDRAGRCAPAGGLRHPQPLTVIFKEYQTSPSDEGDVFAMQKQNRKCAFSRCAL